MTPDLTTALEWLKLIREGGVTLILAVILWQFYTGRIIPRSILDEILRAYNDEIKIMLKDLAKELKKGGW